MTKHRCLPQIIIIVLFLLAICAPGASSHAQAVLVTVRTNPSILTIEVNQTGDLAIEVVDVQDLYGFDLAITFNPQIVSVVDANPNLSGVQVAFGTFLDSGFVIRNQADNTTGEIQFVMTQLNPSEAKNGTGNLIVIKFKGLQADATSSIVITNALLARRDGTRIDTYPVGGLIKVVSTNPGSTNTPIPTQGGGTPLPTNTSTLPPTNTSVATRTRTPAPTLTAPPPSTKNPTSTVRPPQPTATQSAAGGSLPTPTRTLVNLSNPTATLPPGGPTATQAPPSPPEQTGQPPEPGGSPEISTAEQATSEPSLTPTLAILSTQKAFVTVAQDTLPNSTPATAVALIPTQENGFSLLTTSGVAICVGFIGILIGFILAIGLTRRKKNSPG